jgi:hypothetical protein
VQLKYFGKRRLYMLFCEIFASHDLRVENEFEALIVGFSNGRLLEVLSAALVSHVKNVACLPIEQEIHEFYILNMLVVP